MLVFDWSELVTQQETGGTEILSYNVQWDTGTDGRSWSNLAGYSSNFIASSYTATASIVAGETYLIKVRARNYWGWGDFSDTITIKASTFPGKVNPAITTIDALTGGITVMWIKPLENSDSITQYLIEALLPSGDWSEICDGTDETIVANKQCVIPMETFWEPTTYNKAF